MKKKPVISEREIEKAVAYSCHLEGMDYYAAMKNKEAIRLLQKHGRCLDLICD